MKSVAPNVRYTSVQSCELGFRLDTIERSSLLAGHRPRETAQLLEIAPQRLGCQYFRIFGTERCERGNAEVHADHRLVGPDIRLKIYRDRKAGIPIVSSA